MSTNQRDIVGVIFRGLTVVLAAGIGAYLVVNAQRRANSNAHESAPAPEGAAQSSSTPVGATAESGASELTPEQILLFSSKSAVIEPGAQDDPNAPTLLFSSKVPHVSGVVPPEAFAPATETRAPFLSSSKSLDLGEVIYVPRSDLPPGLSEGLLFGSKSGVIRVPTPEPAPAPQPEVEPASSPAAAPTKPFLGSSKRLEPLRSEPAPAQPSPVAPAKTAPVEPLPAKPTKP
jgi:hypothetical protein